MDLRSDGQQTAVVVDIPNLYGQWVNMLRHNIHTTEFEYNYIVFLYNYYLIELFIIYIK